LLFREELETMGDEELGEGQDTARSETQSCATCAPQAVWSLGLLAPCHEVRNVGCDQEGAANRHFRELERTVLAWQDSLSSKVTRFLIIKLIWLPSVRQNEN
jgi:hypothetical protein